MTFSRNSSHEYSERFLCREKATRIFMTWHVLLGQALRQLFISGVKFIIEYIVNSCREESSCVVDNKYQTKLRLLVLDRKHAVKRVPLVFLPFKVSTVFQPLQFSIMYSTNELISLQARKALTIVSTYNIYITVVSSLETR